MIWKKTIDECYGPSIPMRILTDSNSLFTIVTKASTRSGLQLEIDLEAVK